MRRLAMLIAACTFVLGGCNTIEGAGKDVKAGGTKIEDTAKEAKEKM